MSSRYTDMSGERFLSELRQSATHRPPADWAGLMAATAERLELYLDRHDVTLFATLMAAKMRKKSKEGARGWRKAQLPMLQQMLRDHVGKGDMVDVAIMAMMIHFWSEPSTDD